MGPTDEELMSAYVAGDVRAFEKLFARLAPRVHGFFLRSFRDAGVADDLLQATFMKVHRARQQYRQDRKVGPWLFAVAARVRLDELRRRGRTPESTKKNFFFDEEGEEEEIAAPPADPPDRDLQDAVRAALDALPESQRTVIHLHRFEEMTFAEIAEALGTTAGAVKLRAFRGYEKLRQRLKGLL